MSPTVRQLNLLARAAFALCFVVVVLGAYVRLSAAGLGCPDWPGCYGHVSPLGAAASFGGQEIAVEKAWKEMIHRYAAGTLGVLIVLIAALAIQSRRERILSPVLATGLLGLVVLQGILGMLTVTWQLKPLIVSGHLLLGLATLSLLWWIVLTLARAGGSAFAERQTALLPRGLVLAALAALIMQIALGGWTSSNYAATACPDLPKCQNAWLPTTDYQDAFVLWRGLGINYEGGVLDHPARVAIHFTHRLGAILATAMLVVVGLRGRRAPAGSRQRGAATAVLVALVLQLGIAVFMILRGFPLWLATAHNAGAALLLLASLALVHATWLPSVRPRTSVA